MMIHKATHRDDIDYKCQKKEEEGLTSIEDSVDEAKQEIKDYIKKRAKKN